MIIHIFFLNRIPSPFLVVRVFFKNPDPATSLLVAHLAFVVAAEYGDFTHIMAPELLQQVGL